MSGSQADLQKNLLCFQLNYFNSSFFQGSKAQTASLPRVLKQLSTADCVHRRPRQASTMHTEQWSPLGPPGWEEGPRQTWRFAKGRSETTQQLTHGVTNPENGSVRWFNSKIRVKCCLYGIHLSCDPAISILEIFPREIKLYVYTATCTQIAALIITAQN